MRPRRSRRSWRGDGLVPRPQAPARHVAHARQPDRSGGGRGVRGRHLRDHAGRVRGARRGAGDLLRDHRFADVFAERERMPRTLLPRIEKIPASPRPKGASSTRRSSTFPDSRNPATALIVSVPADRRPELNDLFVRQGRYLTPGARNEVILRGVRDRPAARARRDPRCGHQRALAGLRVVGVANSPEFIYVIGGAGCSPTTSASADVDGSRDARRDLRHGGRVNSVAIRLAPGGSERDVIVGLDALLARYGGEGAYGRGEQPSHQMLDGEITQDRVTGIVVPADLSRRRRVPDPQRTSALIALQRAQIACSRRSATRIAPSPRTT